MLVPNIWTGVDQELNPRIDAERRSAAVNRLSETPRPLNRIIVVMEAGKSMQAKHKKYQLVTFIGAFQQNIKELLNVFWSDRGEIHESCRHFMKLWISIMALCYLFLFPTVLIEYESLLRLQASEIKGVYRIFTKYVFCQVDDCECIFIWWTSVGFMAVHEKSLCCVLL